MANMSYCRFENTASDLADCADHVLESNESLSSDYERDGRVELVLTCARILETLGFHVEGDGGRDITKHDVERVLDELQTPGDEEE